MVKKLIKLKKKQRNVLIVVVVFAIIITSIEIIQFTGFMPYYDEPWVDIDPPDPIPDPPFDPDLEPISDLILPNEPILNTIESPCITGKLHISWSSVSNADDYAIYSSND